MKTFPFFRQLHSKDCGPTCLRMIAKFYGKHFNLEGIKRESGFWKDGVNMLGIANAAENIGFRTQGVRITYEQLTSDITLPCIVHWQQNHFVVVVSRTKSTFKKQDKIVVADPAVGVINYKKDEFLSSWISSYNDNGDAVGTALLLEPTPKFYEQPGDKERKISWGLALQHLRGHYWEIFEIFVALIITSILQLTFPFLTQSIVDIGINTRNLHFITIVLIAQLMLVFSRTLVDFIRSRLLLGVSSIVNISLLSDFWIKLTRLPIDYFDSHHTGDTLQRISDNRQVQNFLTGSALSTIFSMFNFLIYGSILIFYNIQLFLVFILGSILYYIWIRGFLKMRRNINNQTFKISAKINSATLQMVQGMQEIKMHNAEQLKRWDWENLQAGIFKLSFKTLTFNQIQQAGALFINQGKDVILTFLVARLVIEGNLTIGAMLAIQYIIGQLSGPVDQFVGFVQNAQDARLSLERLNEIHQLTEEEDIGQFSDRQGSESAVNGSILLLKSVGFVYSGNVTKPVLSNITLDIPEGKITAIVGHSGSGKTTLIKLLSKFYNSYTGDINVGELNLKYISPSMWRAQCSVVLQDGFIFNDTIGRNIAVGDESPDYKNLLFAANTANILGFVESLPNGFNTKLGEDGVGISQGQKQRILIARAVYKNPKYLFLDEATNALDANNEKTIVENLGNYFVGRTVIIVAHRLSTVQNADKIVVLDEGKIIEEGSHTELIAIKGQYYELVKNQLQLTD